MPSNKAKGPRLKHLLPSLVVGGLLSFIVAAVVWNVEGQQIAGQFEGDAEDIVAVIRRQADLRLDELSSIATLYLSAKKVSRSDFKDFVKPHMARGKGYQALELVPRIPASQRSAFEHEARKEGFAHFEITEKNSQGQ